jgi:hypothetical protein
LFDKPSPGDISRIVDGLFDVEKNVGRRILERIWWRNILYYIGEQWLEWVQVTSSFRRSRIYTTQPSTPVSNEIREYVRAVKSMLLNQKMVPRVVPNSEERADVDAAEIGKNLLIHMDSLNDFEIEDEKEKLIIAIALWGTGFLRTFPFKEGGEWFVQKNGTVLTTGDVMTENILPFNLIVDANGDTLRKKRFIGIQSLRNREWVEDTFRVKIQATDEMASVDYQRRLMSLVGQVSPWKGSGLDYIASDVPDEDLVSFRELEFKPDKRYPEGRYMVVCGGETIVNLTQMPIPAEKDYWTYTPVDFHFNYVPGRFWSDSGVDDLLSPQNTINEIDRSCAENRRTMGRPTVVTPGEVRLSRLSEKGDHVLVLSYDGLTSGGGRPILQQGIAMPPEVYQQRMNAKVDIQEKGGDPKNILKGQAPSAHASGVMTDILRETAERGHYPDIERFNRSMSRVYKSRILVAKSVYTEERIIKVQGKGNRVKILHFKASDLRGNTDVRMEIDSGLVTTKAGQRATLMDLLKLGFFANDLQSDPTIRHQLITRFGFSGFADQTNGDIDRAERENSAIAAGALEGIMTVTMPVGPDSQVVEDDPLFKYDNDTIHYEVHRRYILSPEFSELPTTSQEAMMMQGGGGGKQPGGGMGGANPMGSQPNPGLETTSGGAGPEGGTV